MATQYPTEQEEFGRELERLGKKIKELEASSNELNISLMRKSAEASEAKEELKRLKLEWEIVADQKGHNLCWASIARALKATIGHTGKYPDPENCSPEQFAQGCVAYHGDLYPNCGVGLSVIKSDRT